jgi:hypothetical protein
MALRCSLPTRLGYMRDRECLPVSPEEAPHYFSLCVIGTNLLRAKRIQVSATLEVQ